MSATINIKNKKAKFEYEFLESYTINSGLHIEILQHANKKNQGRNATRNLALEVLHSDLQG